MMRLRNMTTGEIVATRVERAENWYARFVGFLRRSRVEITDALWLEGCSLIHTVGMQTQIDVVFLDKERRVLRTVCSVPRNRFAVVCPGAHTVVELGCGALQHTDVLVGDQFALEE